MGLASWPLVLLKLALVVLVTWTELAKTAVYVHLSLAWKMLVWALAFLTLPLRVVTAIGRHRQLEMEVHYLRRQLESVAWERRELRRRHKLILADVELQHRNALSKIQLLQDRIGELKKANRQAERKDSRHGILTTHTKPQSLTRDTAFTQSLFSAVLSLWVGAIVWEAEQRCMPLVVAFFAVVVMSLKTVLRFFSAVQTKPASDAVALLSLNCFILGALTYPTLPTLAPLGFRLLYTAVRFLPFSYL